MSLRARLVVAYLAVVIVLGIALVGVARTQRDHLVDQIDRRLAAARPFLQPFPDVVPLDEVDRIEPKPPPQDTPPDGPISDLFVGVFGADGEVREQSAGVLLDDRPALDVEDLVAIDATASGSDGGPVLRTVDGVSGDSEFRVAIQPHPDGSWSVVALPLDEANDAVRRLVLGLAVTAAIVLLAMALTMWWVFRLGLRPVARMTDAATEIAAGRRERRVGDTDGRTEVGRLGLALNEMLDERDRNEDKLRQFVADASHELRTPLTSIRGGLDLALDETMVPERRDDVLRRVRAESRRMHDLVEDLLLLASLDSGRPLRCEPVDLVAVVHDAADDARALQPARSVSVEPDDGGGTDPIVVTGDEMRLRQVVAGLVHNALHHTPTDAALRLSVQRDTTGVVLTVADSGPGLTPMQASAVFDRFSRGDPSRSRHAGGTGLGLAIARSIVEAHDGSLDLVTAPGEGCTFVVRLRPS